MRFQLSTGAQNDYELLSPVIRKAAQKQLDFLVRDLRHPSLHAKKYDEATGLWQARINRSWRLYFLIVNDHYFVISIRKHPK